MKHRISEVGARMLKYQEQLARDYGYKPIPRTFFCDVRAEFQKALPKWCNVSGDTISLETADGTVIANGYNRVHDELSFCVLPALSKKNILNRWCGSAF